MTGESDLVGDGGGGEGGEEVNLLFAILPGEDCPSYSRCIFAVFVGTRNNTKAQPWRSTKRKKKKAFFASRRNWAKTLVKSVRPIKTKLGHGELDSSMTKVVPGCG